MRGFPFFGARKKQKNVSKLIHDTPSFVDVTKVRSSQARTSSVDANQPRRPGTVNMGTGNLPAIRALVSADTVLNPRARAVSCADIIGAAGR